MADNLELEPGFLEQALELEGAALIEPLVVVIEGGETAEAGQDLLRRADSPNHMMSAGPGWIEGTLQQLHRLHDDELVEPGLGQGKPAADKGAVLFALGELSPGLLILQPGCDPGKAAHDGRGQPGDGIEPPQQLQDDPGQFAHGGPRLLSSGGMIAQSEGAWDKF
jgi:hypothetical protein